MSQSRRSRVTPTGSTPLDLLDFVHLRAAGSSHFDAGALRLADEGARERRRNRNFAFPRVSLRLADDLPYGLPAGIFVDQGDGGSELDGGAGQLGNVDDLGARELILEIGDPGLILCLRLHGGVILGVLRNIGVV